jgi:hypothetical protein
MAVVIHPEDPSLFREGVTLSAEWEVVDGLGRHGQAEGVFRLQRNEHSVTMKE